MVLLAFLATACGSGRADTDKDKLLQLVRNTEPLARTFVYTEAAGGRTVRVDGVIEDSFRYSAKVSVDGTPAYEQVVSDDSLSVVVLDKAATQRALPATGSGIDSSPAAAALNSAKWVTDKAGAPSTVAVAGERRDIGVNPVSDALGVLSYAELAAGQALFVVEFNPDDISYRPAEDPFPHPNLDDRVDRYDFRQPNLPQVSQLTGGNQATPGVEHFRKLGVYVKNGRIQSIVEKIDVEARLDDLSRIYGVQFPANLAASEAVNIAVDSINALRRGQGNDPIRVREMSLQLSQIGGSHTVMVPQGAVEAALPFLRPATGDSVGAAAAAVPGGAIPGAGGASSALAGLAATPGPDATARPAGAFDLGALSQEGRQQETRQEAPAPSGGSVLMWLVAAPVVVAAGGFALLRLRGGTSI